MSSMLQTVHWVQEDELPLALCTFSTHSHPAEMMVEGRRDLVLHDVAVCPFSCKSLVTLPVRRIPSVLLLSRGHCQTRRLFKAIHQDYSLILQKIMSEICPCISNECRRTLVTSSSLHMRLQSRQLKWPSHLGWNSFFQKDFTFF